MRHFILGNLLKMYDKKGSVLRIETLLHDLHHFWVFRPEEGRMLRMRKGLADLKKQASAVTRLLGLLRGHGLIAKVPKTHRYQLTENGRSALTLVQVQSE